MTLLDAAVIALLLLIAAGGYYQGFLRGLMRLIGLLSIGLLTALLSIGASLQGSIQQVVLRTFALFCGGTLVVGVAIWLLNRLIPPALHRSRINKLLGVLPALLQGVIVLALALGFVHRVALEQETQGYIARGLVSGPLIEPFAWFEQSLAGVR
jgi:uncharacterized membrane protein required for colicin V production